MRINVFFEGGGILGICYIGAYKALSDYGIFIDKALGISSGSIVAALIVSGFSANEITSLLTTFDDFSFLKKKTDFANKNVFGKPLSILIKKGIYDSEVIEDFMDFLLSKKNISTFQDVCFASESRLKIIAADFTLKKMILLPDDLKKYGYNPYKFKIAKAVRMSCAIPFYYTPYIIEGLRNNHYIIDGGVIKNIPTTIIEEKNKLTLRFKIKGYKGKLTNKIDNIKHTFVNRKQKEQNTITIPLNYKIKPTDFKITKEQIIYLYKQGYKATYKYIKNNLSK